MSISSEAPKTQVKQGVTESEGSEGAPAEQLELLFERLLTAKQDTGQGDVSGAEPVTGPSRKVTDAGPDAAQNTLHISFPLQSRQK